MSYKIDAGDVRRAASGKWLELLPRIDSRLSAACLGAGVHHPCPAGTGTRDGFRIPEDAAIDGHAYSNQLPPDALSDGFKVLMWLNSWSFYQALSAVNEALNGADFPATSKKPVIRGKDYSKKRAVFKRWLADSSDIPSRLAIRYYIERGLLDAHRLRSGALRYIDAVPYFYDDAYIKNQDGSLFTTPAILCGMRTESAVTGFSVIRIDSEGHKADSALKQALELERGIIDAKVRSKQLLSIRPMAGSCCRFGEIGTEWLVGEGVETMLAVASAFKTDSVAAACTAQLLEQIEIPEHVKILRIFADKDKNGRGLVAAENLKERAGSNIKVVIHLPTTEIPDGQSGIDWLDCKKELGELSLSLSKTT